MDEHPLDRPVWTSLTTTHAGFSEGPESAKALQPEVGPFAAPRDETSESLAALSDLVATRGELLIPQVASLRVPANARIKERHPVVQMVYDGVRKMEHPPFDLVPLNDTDSPAMVALAKLTNPGPFGSRTHKLGQFWGVKSEGKLLAMAGERFKQPGFTEISGVCTHPEAQGKGYGTALCRHLCAAILDRGEIPYLHAFESNERAVGVYTSMGFKIRARLNAVILTHMPPETG